MVEIEKYFCSLYDKIASGMYSIETLEECDQFIGEKSKNYITYLQNTNEASINIEALRKFIVIQLDYYTFSVLGNVFISDSDYDLAVSIYNRISGSKAPVTTTFKPSSLAWPIKEHKAPQMVGSVEKVFDVETVEKFIINNTKGLFGSTNIVFAPKYDGVGVCLEYDPVTVDFVSALTRKDGMHGQELIKVIKASKNYSELLMLAANEFGDSTGFIKCEILLGEHDFEELIKEKPYKNRRNGTSGIINTPSNVQYAKYLTVMPLAYGAMNSRKEYRYNYSPKGSYIVSIDGINDNPKLIEEYINRILNETHNSEFEFRTDGVVVFIYNKHIQYSNVMDHAVAFKTNSKYGITQIEYGYLSMGRTGVATPMIKVKPCDVNETVVTDVSLSNFAKVKKLGLHEGDTIMIESAGDVIPMVKSIIKMGSPDELRFKTVCPECGKRLISEYSETGNLVLKCKNPDCPRVIVGVIANFFNKLGANGISDATIGQLHAQLNLSSIEDFLDTDRYYDELMNIPGWGVASAENFVNEINRIKDKPISHGEFMGALGIPNISTEKCKSIFSTIDYDKFMGYIRDYKEERAEEMIYTVDRMGTKTIKAFMDFVVNNYEHIRDISKYLKLTQDTVASQNVVFTGFRDAAMEKYFREHGIDVSDNIKTGTTIAVIAAKMDSGKVKTAMKRGIPVVTLYGYDSWQDACDHVINALAQ